MRVAKVVRATLQAVAVAALSGLGLLITMAARWMEVHPSLHMAGSARVVELVGSAFLHGGGGLLFVVLANYIFIPWLNLFDLVFPGNDAQTAGMTPALRIECIRGWFLLAAAMIVAFAWAGV